MPCAAAAVFESSATGFGEALGEEAVLSLGFDTPLERHMEGRREKIDICSSPGSGNGYVGNRWPISCT